MINIFVGIFILILISILCFINVVGYLSVYILIQARTPRPLLPYRKDPSTPLFAKGVCGPKG